MKHVLPCHVIEEPGMKLFIRAVVDDGEGEGEGDGNGHGPPGRALPIEHEVEHEIEREVVLA